MTDPERAWRGPEPVMPVEQLRLDNVCLPAQARRRADMPTLVAVETPAQLDWWVELTAHRAAQGLPPSARTGPVFECVDWLLEERRKEARQRRQDAREDRGVKQTSERARKSAPTRTSGRSQAPTPDDPRFRETQKGKRSENAASLVAEHYRAGGDFDNHYELLEPSPLGVALFAHRKLRGETARHWYKRHVWDPTVAWVDSTCPVALHAPRSPREVYGDPDAAADMVAFLERANLADDERLVGMLLATRATHHGRTFYCSLAQRVAVLKEAGVTYDFENWRGEHRKVEPNWRHAQRATESLEAKFAVYRHDRAGLHEHQATYFTITAPHAMAQAVDLYLSPTTPVDTPLCNSSSEGVSLADGDRLQADRGLYPGMPVRLLTDDELSRVRSRSMFGAESDWWRYWRGAGTPERATTASQVLLAA